MKTCIVSAKTGYGMDELSPYLQKSKTLVFLGSSGVGKSSLVNALAGENIMDTNGIREDDSKGRHTTTRREQSAELQKPRLSDISRFRHRRGRERRSSRSGVPDGEGAEKRRA